MSTLWREYQAAWLSGGPRLAIPPAAFDEARRRAQELRDEAVADAFLALRRIAGRAGARPTAAADRRAS